VIRSPTPPRLVVLEVRGRHTGRAVSVPLVALTLGARRYLLAARGDRAGWVRDVRAAGGRAVLRHGLREPVHLEELPAAERAPVLRRFLELPRRVGRRARPAPEAGDVAVFRVDPVRVTPVERARRAGSR
jgi:hypothetical protein